MKVIEKGERNETVLLETKASKLTRSNNDCDHECHIKILGH